MSQFVPQGQYIEISAFNLWKGAVFMDEETPDGGWTPFVVTELIRNNDTEQVVIFYREVWDDDSDMIPTTRPAVLDYATPARVVGNIVNPEEISDNNWGSTS